MFSDRFEFEILEEEDWAKLGKLVQSNLNRQAVEVESRLIKTLTEHVAGQMKALSKKIETVESGNEILKSKQAMLEYRDVNKSIEIVNFPLIDTVSPLEIAERIMKKLPVNVKVREAYRCGKVKLINNAKCQDVIFELENSEQVESALKAIKNFSSTNKPWTADQLFQRCTAVARISMYRKLPAYLMTLKWLAKKKNESLKYPFCWINKSGKLMMKKNPASKAKWIQTPTKLESLK